MAIARYRDPASLFGLHRLNRILDEAFAAPAFAEQGNAITSTRFAPTDVSEDTNSLRITMELPGVNSDDVRLSLENHILTIRGEKSMTAKTTASGSTASSALTGSSSGRSFYRTPSIQRRSKPGMRTECCL